MPQTVKQIASLLPVKIYFTGSFGLLYKCEKVTNKCHERKLDLGSENLFWKNIHSYVLFLIYFGNPVFQILKVCLSYLGRVSK